MYRIINYKHVLLVLSLYLKQCIFELFGSQGKLLNTQTLIEILPRLRQLGAGSDTG
jgi:hypothetical protein